jgi:parallel beta-helix repeat protein
VTLISSKTLTITPGTTVSFASGTTVTINGKLVADGNDPNQRITFTGTTATPGFWNGIKINSGSSTNVSTLRRCDVQYATDGITITYTGNSNNVTVDKCNIRNNSADGVYINGDNWSGATVNPTISNNAISNNGGNGIDLVNYAKPTITGNRIENNSASGIYASNSPPKVEYNFISGNTEFGLWFTYTSLAELNRNTIKANSGRGVNCISNSNVSAYGSGNSKGRNEITGNTSIGIYSGSSSPIFGKDVSGQYGNNWIHDNNSYEAQQSGSGQLRAERCYWSNQQTNISGNVDVTPVLSSQPSPVGWGQSDTFDPTYRMIFSDSVVATLPAEIHLRFASTAWLSQRGVTSTSPLDWTTELKAAIEEGLSTSDWSRASELITALHRELQNARLPEVDFALLSGYANNANLAPFIRKMLALVLAEKELIENKIATALTKLAAFSQSNSEHAAELLANAGLIHLYRQNDLIAAENVLAQLQRMAQNGDAGATEQAGEFARVLQNYQRHHPTVGGSLERRFVEPQAIVTSPSTPTLVQNYPNPFNPETAIRFHLHERQKVRLVIYDVPGQRVRALAEGEFPSGEQTIVCDGRDQQGRGVASGIYFYELVVGNKKVERKKMTLIR